ncbi:MAG TPA: hypothetical protein VMC43_03565 [Candidatus Paceibacterota bacterium]|nr:hypothetical protein [Candidatus Paceibacterota bacterium]
MVFSGRVERGAAVGTAIFLLVSLGFLPSGRRAQADNTVTTTLEVSICGDGIVQTNEVCDSGVASNTGAYATSSGDKVCLPNCKGYGPYCGDGILQARFGEICDDGSGNGGATDRCSADCQSYNTNIPNTGGGGGGGIAGGGYSPPQETRVTIQGKAYPSADVNILKDGGVVGVVKANTKADFYFTTTNLTPGVATFGFWATDQSGLKSISLNTTLTIVAGAVTTISGAFIPPTIALDKRQVAHGDKIVISGQSVPDVTIVTHVNSDQEILSSTSTDDLGRWKIPFDTTPLKTEDFHTAQAHFEISTGGSLVKSQLSQSVTFYVGQNSVGKKFLADLNGDGKVNLVDFSILLYHWGSAGPIGDINGDGKVDLADFSIMLFYWTG